MMTTKLLRSSTSQILVPQLLVADSFFERSQGLLGRESLSAEEAMWIKRCNSIHTFFMKFAIDCVFVNKEMKVVSIHEDVKPWRLILPNFRASSVVEMPSGRCKDLNIKVGESFYVGS